jgi:metallophosphoesterase superfamily enzyme
MLVQPRGVNESISLKLLPGRAALLLRDATLLVADLHLGKAASFRQAGLPVPEGSASADLSRLERLVAEVQACRLGRVEVVLVEGNHDRRVRIPVDLGIDQIVTSLEEPPWRFLHEPPPTLAEGRVHCCGHLHPRLSLRSPSGDRLSQRCFVEEPGLWVLPAFGSFTGSSVVPIKATTRVWAAGDDAVVDVTRMAQLAAGRRPQPAPASETRQGGD